MLHFKHFLTAVLAFAAISTCEIYTLAPSLPGHPLDGQAINAQGRSLFTGFSAPSTYCPVDPNCPQNPMNRTLFAGLMGVYVMVPGGQQTYITQDGAIGMTQAHSASVPSGAYREGWIYVTSSTSPSKQLISWEAPDKSTSGIYACLVREVSAMRPASYQIYAKTPAFTRTDCVQLEGLEQGLLPDVTPIEVWQYI